MFSTLYKCFPQNKFPQLSKLIAMKIVSIHMFMSLVYETPEMIEVKWAIITRIRNNVRVKGWRVVLGDSHQL